MCLRRTSVLVGLAILVAIGWGCKKDTHEHGLPGNTTPALAQPSGPGISGGADPAYTSQVSLGSLLDFSVTATDPDGSDILTLGVAVTGGTLTAAAAGFTTPLPLPVQGPSPLTLSLDGPAAAMGDIELSFDASDGLGGIKQITMAITITACQPLIGAPSGPGFVQGADPVYWTTVAIGDSLNFTVIASDSCPINVLSFTADVTGGTLTSAQAGFTQTFPVVVLGFSPQTLSFAGTAAMIGDIEITFDLDNGQGGTHVIVLNITIV